MEQPEAPAVDWSTPIARNRSSRQSRAQVSGSPCAFHSSQPFIDRRQQLFGALSRHGSDAANTQRRASSGSESNETMGIGESGIDGCGDIVNLQSAI